MLIGKKVNGLYEGKVTSFPLHNGKPTEVTFITDYEHGKKEGRRITYQYSRLTQIASCHEDTLEGIDIMFLPYAFALWSNHLGNYDGMMIEYDDSGKLSSVTNFKEGDEIGKVLFYPSGKVAAKGNEIHGFKTGEWVEFDSTYTSYSVGNYLAFRETIQATDTIIVVEGTYKVGKWNTYSTEGKFIKSEFFPFDDKKKSIDDNNLKMELELKSK